MAKLSKIIASLALIAPIILLSCRPASSVQALKPGLWRVSLNMQGQTMPFLLEVSSKEEAPAMYILNGDERILLDEFYYKDDSVIIPMHAFDAELRAKIEGDFLTGIFYKYYLGDYQIPFRGEWGVTHRFPILGTEINVDFTGKWDVSFVHHSDTVPAVGIFAQVGNQISGTFLLATGDYRYLAGAVEGQKAYLSTFDGNHAFLFLLEMQEDGQLLGDFWSGTHWHETIKATRNAAASLPEAEKLTYLKEGFETLHFSLPDLEGRWVNLQQERFHGKVVILQLMGTWCPNCMDETKFLSQWYPKNQSRGVEILGLAFEAKDDFGYATARVKKMKEKWQVPYDFVIAGVNEKDKASAQLPELNRLVAWPTLIFIDKKGRVRHIHTGFNGPGTGHYYEQFIDSFNRLVNSMLAE
jgi:thiol-disulfide isomerase/thioredoxin